MRVSCACPVDLASDTLIAKLETLGLKPIVTSQVIRAVYEGSDRRLGEAIVEIYAHEADHEINVQYDKDEQRREQRRFERRMERAQRNDKLHGH